MASYNVTALPEYVNQNTDLLMAKTVMGAKSADIFTLQTGVKGKTALNILNTNVEFGDGSTCGWNDAGEASLSQRILEPAYLKVNMSICDKVLLGKWAEYEVKVAADKVASDLPFEATLMESILSGVNKKLETMIWNGTKSTNSFDGILTILATGAKTVTGATAYETIKAAAAAMPAEALEGTPVIFVGEDTYRTYMQELVDANLFHYDPANGADGYMVPGTAIKVIATPGLNGTSKVVAGDAANFFYGVNLEDDKDTIDVWYSKDNREFRVAIEFVAGVQVAFPDETVVGTIQ